MPIYEYRCCCCDQCFETLLLKSDDPEPACPHCGADKVERLLSSFACTTATRTSDRTTSAAGCGSGGFS
ncbi:MAG: zinc ribbon domain-containing protein [Syntrophobacterales bacterium]